MKAFILACWCMFLIILPTAAQDDCTLAPRLQAGEGGRMVFVDGTPRMIRSQPGTGRAITFLYEGQSFVLNDRDPVCHDGVRWWEISVQMRNVFEDGWVAEGADGVYFAEPLARDQAQANVTLYTGLFYGRLWAIVERDRRGIFTPTGAMFSDGIITTTRQGKISNAYNALYYWNQTGLYRTRIVDGKTQILAGDQTHIVDVGNSDWNMSVLYAEDCDRCYTFYTYDLSPTSNAYEPTLIWSGKTDYPLVGIAGIVGWNDVDWVLEADTVRRDSPFPASGGQLMRVSPGRGLIPLKAISGSDQAMEYRGTWLAAASDKVQLIRLENGAHYTIPLRYGERAVLPMFSDAGISLVWFELDYEGDTLQTVTVRSLDLWALQTTTLYSFDVRDGYLPVPQVVLGSEEFTLLYRGSLMIFSMAGAINTTWFPAAKPDVLGAIWIGD